MRKFSNDLISSLSGKLVHPLHAAIEQQFAEMIKVKRSVYIPPINSTETLDCAPPPVDEWVIVRVKAIDQEERTE